jgi:hypothetical protein
MGLIESNRGDQLEELVAEVTEMAGDSTDPDELFALGMSRATAALMSGQLDRAFDVAIEVTRMQTQNSEVPFFLAVRAAAWAGHLERARVAALGIESTAFTGGLGQASRAHANAIVAALEGRTADALDGFTTARNSLREMEQHFAVAYATVDAAVVLPGEPEVRGWAAEVRPLLEELRARPYLDRLDTALAEAAPARATPAGERTLPVQG